MACVQLDDVGPSTVIEERYRCAELLSEIELPGGPVRIYRAFDEVLWRPVALHVIDGDHPRARALVESARSAAAVNDRRLLAVYDAHINGIAYVIREWFEGHNLDTVLSQGPLEPRRAARIALEIAEALAVAHAAGLSHRRLDLYAVLLGRDDTVKVAGLAIDAAIEGPAQLVRGDVIDPAAREDARDLGLILHACLTTRWGGTGLSRLFEAPRDGEGRLLAPRQVRAGLPRSLDNVTDRAMNDHPHTGLALASPAEVAAALVDAGAGDPIPVFDLPPVQTTMPRAFSSGTVVPTEQNRRDAQEWAAGQTPTPAPTAGSAEDTQFSLAAQAGFDRDQQTAYAGPAVGAAGGSAVTAAPPKPAKRPRDPSVRSRRSLGIGLVVALLLAGMVLLGWQLGTTAFRRDRDQTAAGDTPTPTPGSPPTAAAVKLAVTGAGDFDPEGDGSEHPDEVALAHDGKPATAWTTATYETSPKLGNLKPGVGMWVDLGAVKNVASVNIDLVGSGSDVSLYVPDQPDATAAPDSLSGWRKVGGQTGAGASTLVTLRQPAQARFVLVWFTKLPPDGQGTYRGGVSEIEVRG
jgi:hypothetical protein